METDGLKVALEIRDLVKSYGKNAPVLRGVDLQVMEGRLHALLGSNGVGKTTTLKAIMGWVRYSGQILIHGQPIDQVLHRVSYLPEEKSLYGNYTLIQLIPLCKKILPGFRAEQMKDWIHSFNLPMERKISSLSQGMRSIVYASIALSREADLYLLDEPTFALDAIARDTLLELIREKLYEGKTILYTSHIIPEVERIADTVSIIDHGKILLSVSMDEIKENFRILYIPTECEALLSSKPFRSIQKKEHHWAALVDNEDPWWESMGPGLKITSQIPDLNDFFQVLVRGNANVL